MCHYLIQWSSHEWASILVSMKLTFLGPYWAGFLLTFFAPCLNCAGDCGVTAIEKWFMFNIDLCHENVVGLMSRSMKKMTPPTMCHTTICKLELSYRIWNKITVINMICIGWCRIKLTIIIYANAWMERNVIVDRSICSVHSDTTHDKWLTSNKSLIVKSFTNCKLKLPFELIWTLPSLRW